MEPNVSSTVGGIFDGFEDYRTPSDDDYRRIFKAGLVVFDANVLLNLYRFNSTTRRDLIAVMQGLGGNLWIPHQVMREFWRNRESTLDRLNDGPRESLELLEKANKTAENAVSAWSKKIALDDARKSDLMDKLETAFRTVREAMIAQAADDAAEHARDTNADTILSTLASTLANRVGSALPSEDHAAALIEAERRIAAQEPPGFLDADKTNEDLRAGDYLVWEQLLREAEQRKCDVLLVTSDVKDDWWSRVKSDLRGPRPELAAEFRERAGSRFFMLTPSEFVTKAAALTSVSVNPRSAADIERVGNPLNDPLPADVAFEVVERLFNHAIAVNWHNLSGSARMRDLSALVDDPAIGGVLQNYFTLEGTRAWMKDTLNRHFNYALKGFGRYQHLVRMRHQTPQEVIAAACGPSWYVVPDSQGLRPYHCLASDGSNSRYVCWGPERSFRDLLFAAMNNHSTEQERSAVVILHGDAVDNAQHYRDMATQAGVDLVFLEEELKLNLDYAP
ncbi:PIN-like domain-containing protein [Lentzea albidocapillata]|uniref:PIN like domain-containing protein n=1 Tax=Lentzea albidocapillata TaxID=40571 RepID=A0A1W2FS40_9PSEU|nr:PIN domain-containing protein [Lentzea albidocapillata]SMD24745.1 hypothetical protein SAMN05660733_07825 [Lentzea albidocapillata]